MPKYRVLLTRACTESTEVTVEAEDADAAEQKAVADRALWEAADWRFNEGSDDGEVFICDPGGCAEELTRTLVVRNLSLRVDAFGNDPKKEAIDVVRSINDLIVKLGGDPVLDFDAPSNEEIAAEYREETVG